MMFNKPKHLVWLCDYHDSDKTTKATWETCHDEKYTKDLSLQYAENKYYIINHTKELYIDVNKLMNLYKEDESYNGWMIHPIPILCNSDLNSMGGGDFHQADSRRAIWATDEIETSFDKPNNYIDVTEDCLFFER